AEIDTRPAEAGVARLAVGSVQHLRLTGRVLIKDHVVDDLAITGQEVNRRHVRGRRETCGDYKTAIDVRADGRRKALRHREYDIRLAQRPGAGRDDWRRQIGRVARGHTVADPVQDHLLFIIGQGAGVAEVAIAGYRLPGRHLPGDD